MKKLVVLMAGALMLSSVAFAAPRALSGAELDAVTAGSMLDSVMSTFLGSSTQSASVEEAAAVAPGSNSIAIEADNSDVTAAGAVADNDGVAVNGDDNVTVKNDGNIAALGSVAGDNNQYRYTDINAEVAINTNDDGDVTLTETDTRIENEIEDIDDGSAAVIGDGNHVAVTTDNSEIDVDTDGGDLFGVVAREATISDSFNTKEVDVDVEVEIEDSFNVTTNTMDISGQNGLTAIVNANSLNGLQGIGANLNVTSASAEVPTMQGNDSASVPIIAGNAIAVTVLNQLVINNSIIANSTIAL